MVQSLDRKPPAGKLDTDCHNEHQVGEGHHHVVGVKQCILLPVHTQHLAHGSHVDGASCEAGSVHAGNLGPVGDVGSEDGITGNDCHYHCHQACDHCNQLVAGFALAEGEAEEHQRDRKGNHGIGKCILHGGEFFPAGKDTDVCKDGSKEIEHQDRPDLSYPLDFAAQPQHSGRDDAVGDNKDR